MKPLKPHDLLGKPAPSFDEPVEMLKACHGRITAQCATLGKLADYLPAHGADIQAQQAARNVMRYFDTAGQHHHADEEDDLFPMLLEAARREHSPVAQLIESLIDEHRCLEAEWAKVRAALSEIAEGRQVPLERAWMERFAEAYRRHMTLEEGQVLPFAEAHLSQPQLTALSESMVARRTSHA